MMTRPRERGVWLVAWGGRKKHFWVHGKPLCQPNSKMFPHRQDDWANIRKVGLCTKCEEKLRKLELEYEHR